MRYIVGVRGEGNRGGAIHDNVLFPVGSACVPYHCDKEFARNIDLVNCYRRCPNCWVSCIVGNKSGAGRPQSGKYGGDHENRVYAFLRWSALNRAGFPFPNDFRQLASGMPAHARFVSRQPLFWISFSCYFGSLKSIRQDDGDQERREHQNRRKNST